MVSRRILAFVSFLAVAAAQAQDVTEVTDCHSHGDATIYCFDSTGAEWEITTAVDSADPPIKFTDCHAYGADELHCTEGYLEVTLVSVSAASEADHDHEESSAEEITEVTGCHLHDGVQFCFAGGAEYEVLEGPEAANAPEEYTDCHGHGDELHCTGDGLDVTLAAAATDDSHREDTAAESSVTQEGVSCHFHAGVEHCVDAEGNTVDTGCARPEYEYDVPLRIGLLFAVLATSAIGVFIPIFTEKFSNLKMDHIVFIGLRQFGTGVIISTALVHLFTHAQIYFSNECLGRLEYEATTAAIVMAGAFVTFVLEYVAHRCASPRHTHSPSSSTTEADKSPSSNKSDHEAMVPGSIDGNSLTLNTTIIEAGIIFHSILLGVVLVVANDSAFITLYIVITFHQLFEGIALGTRIAIIPGGFIRQIVLGVAFAITTPIGMAVGIGALSSFNGNDPATLTAIGTLNAFSAGVLLWIGVTEMWYKEWWYGALARGGAARTTVGFVGLVLGLFLMSLLGKWA